MLREIARVSGASSRAGASIVAATPADLPGRGLGQHPAQVPSTPMTRKSISTTRAAVACDVCGRTLLRGEHADPFIAGGARRMVCELCTARAANEGWIREGADNTLGVRRNGPRGGRSLLGRLRPTRPAGRRSADADEVVPVSRRGYSNVDRIETAERVADAAEESIAADDDGYDHPPAPVASEAVASREPRHVRAVPTNADLKSARALDVFNTTAHPRRISGVARSLGPPAVTVLPSSTEGSIVSIVVGWELCWYRYEVDLADEAAGVRVTGQGAELSELGPEELEPNAAADERGLLVLAG